jgi:hypothetical protein
VTKPLEDEDDEKDVPIDAKDDEAVRALLKRTLGAGMSGGPKDEPSPDLLRGVQRKIRQRSKGKFYGDGWSTAQSRVSYVLIALVMLVLAVVVYFVLGPLGLTAR